MDAGNTDPLGLSVYSDFDPTAFSQGKIILRNLIALWKIRIKIVLSGKNAERGNFAMCGQCRFHGKFHNFPVKYR